MNKYTAFGLMVVIMEAVQLLSDHFAILLIAAFIMGLLLHRANLNWISYGLAGIASAAITMIFVNGLHWPAVELFSRVFMGIPDWLLFVLSFVVTGVSVGLTARSGTLLLKA